MKTIMIIDDSYTNLILVQSVIDDLAEGFEIVKETDSNVAIERMQAIKPDVVILDIMMPDIDGISILRSMKESPDLKDIPVIILSALPGREKEKEALKLGASYYIRKPLVVTELVEKIQESTLHQLT